MDWANEKKRSDTCACVRTQQRARKRCEAACCACCGCCVVRMRVVHVVRARQLPSPGPRAPKVMFIVGEAPVHEGGKGIRLGGP